MKEIRKGGDVVRLPERVKADRVIAKLRDAERALQQATTIHQAKLVADVAAAQEVFAHRQRLGDEIEGYAFEIKTYALAKLGELLKAAQELGQIADRGRPKKGSNAELLSTALNLPKSEAKKVAAVAQQLASLPAPTRDAIAKREQTLADVRREQKRVEARTKLDDLASREAAAPTGQYDVIVIDPPWPMEKIERDVRPNQVEFDYDPMQEDALRRLEIPTADDCHVWLWTTHRFLPMAFRLLDAWSLKYVCTFVWHKPGGFQPIGLPQYNSEFALYARRGSPSFLDTKNLPTCFQAPRGKHSEKPEEFYATLRRVTGGRRLDMFNRRQIEGFTGWGKEAAA